MPSIITKQEEVAGIPVEAVELRWQSCAHGLERLTLCPLQVLVLSAHYIQTPGF